MPAVIPALRRWRQRMLGAYAVALGPPIAASALALLSLLGLVWIDEVVWQVINGLMFAWVIVGSVGIHGVYVSRPDDAAAWRGEQDPQ